MRKKLDDNLIYGTALDFFAKYGYKKTTLEDIAAALGMSGSNMYSYAKSKKELYCSCIAYGINDWQEAVREAVKKTDDPKGQLILAFDEAVNYLETHPVIQDLLKNDPAIFPMFPAIDPIESFNNWSLAFIKDLLDRGIAAGEFNEMDTTGTSIILFNIYKYFIISAYVDTSAEGIDLNLQKKSMAELILNGLVK